MGLLSAALAPLLLSACPTVPVPNRPTETEAIPPSASLSIEPGAQVLVLGNGAGLRVALLPVREGGDQAGGDRFLIQRRGADDELDDLVLLAERRPSASGHSFYASVHGQARALLSKRAGAPSPWRVVQPNRVQQWTGLEPLVEEVKAEELLALHRSQELSGQIEDVAPRGRPERQRAQDQLFAAETSAMRAACGIDANIDWESVEDRWFEELSVSRACSRMAEGVAEFCSLHPHTLPALKKMGPLVCAFEGDPRHREAKLRAAQGKGLVFAPGASLQAYAAIDLPLLRLFGEVDQVLRSGELRIVVRLGLEKLAIFAGEGQELFPVAAAPPALSGHFRSENLLSGAVPARLTRDAAGWHLLCGDDARPLEKLLGEERAKTLSAAQYQAEPKFKREPYFLARDSRGTYYYVDRDRKEFGGQRYRVFVGRRGQVRLSKLEGLVEDSEGTLFSTERGNLRLLVGARETSGIWIQGRKETVLTTIATASNLGLIFDELGVYFGEDLGLLCNAVGPE